MEKFNDLKKGDLLYIAIFDLIESYVFTEKLEYDALEEDTNVLIFTDPYKQYTSIEEQHKESDYYIFPSDRKFFICTDNDSSSGNTITFYAPSKELLKQAIECKFLEIRRELFLNIDSNL